MPALISLSTLVILAHNEDALKALGRAPPKDNNVELTHWKIYLKKNLPVMLSAQSGIFLFSEMSSISLPSF